MSKKKEAKIRISVSMTEAQRDFIKEASQQVTGKLSEFILSTILKEAEKKLGVIFSKWKGDHATKVQNQEPEEIRWA